MLREEIDILIVEDNSNDLELALHVLRSERISERIHVARDGEEALDFLFCRNRYSARHQDCQPKLILLDLKLPKVTGLDVLGEIKANPRTKSLPVVILTSSKQEQDMIRGYQLGANSYIQKPVDFDQFSGAIQHLSHYWLALNQVPPLWDGKENPV